MTGIVTCMALALVPGSAIADNGILQVKVIDINGKPVQGAIVCLTVNTNDGPKLAKGFSPETTNADGYTAFHGPMQIWNYDASGTAGSNDGSVNWNTNLQLLKITVYPQITKFCPPQYQ